MKDGLVGAETLEAIFPGTPVGQALQNAFGAFVQKNDRFAVLDLRLDGFCTIREAKGDEPVTRLLVRLAGVIDEVARTIGAVWGRLDQERFACFCPEADEAEALRLAKQLQARMGVAGPETASAGVAVYPTQPFEKASILANAGKALDHAAFFGPGTVTPFDAVSLNISGDQRYQAGDLDGAIAEFQNALVLDPRNVNVYNSLGVCFAAQGKLDKALEAFQVAANLDPKEVMGLYNQGLVYLGRDDLPRALEFLSKARALDEENEDIHCRIGECYRRMGQTDMALKHLERACQGPNRPQPRRAGPYRALGECYLEQDRLQEALKAYEKAVRANPRDAESLSTLAKLYAASGENLEIALVLCRESVAVAPENGLYRKRLGRLLLQNGDYETAMEAFESAIRLGEDCQDLLNLAKQDSQQKG